MRKTKKLRDNRGNRTIVLGTRSQSVRDLGGLGEQQLRRQRTTPRVFHWSAGRNSFARHRTLGTLHSPRSRGLVRVSLRAASVDVTRPKETEHAREKESRCEQRERHERPGRAKRRGRTSGRESGRRRTRREEEEEDGR